ncbi:hypothetical protein SAMN05216464_11036 [Mucilaginibacter pineti]|uniref:Uncharacterized protein n=1 Tax=Mucilaginibacter pineti TaxID=1391627 RepID=A0A1G7G9L6_9SPHI|nr:hypothetical protein [Mucilaginibacter pineti]SDE84787.1 hypothetical protein SAMN05216464_11036 [Mucilaginibacter pineti]
MSEDQIKLNLTLKAIAELVNIAAEDPYILNIIRKMPEKDIRFVMDSVIDKDLGAYLTCFEELDEFEWCRVILLVMEERRQAQ